MASVIKERAEKDRRVLDQGPPEGWKDRRRHAERRQIAVLEVSYEEWMAVGAAFVPDTSSSALNDLSENPRRL